VHWVTAPTCAARQRRSRRRGPRTAIKARARLRYQRPLGGVV
jgi:hypothetical protein